MEQNFGENSIDIKVLREFCEREGKMVEYRKGEQLEREGDPARWSNCLDGRPSQTTIKAMMPSRLLRVSGEQLMDFFRQDAEKMELRSIIAEHLLSQARACYLDLHRATARERYELLLQRCPGIVEHLALQDLASFLCITPQMLSKIRKNISFGAPK